MARAWLCIGLLIGAIVAILGYTIGMLIAIYTL